MKRLFGVLLAAGSIAVAACGGSSVQTAEPASTPSTASSEPAPDNSLTYTQDNIDELLSASDTKDVEGAVVDGLVGRVFNIERDGSDVAVQMWVYPDESDGNVIVALPGEQDVSEDDYIKVRGTVLDIFEGDNALGGSITAPRIVATSVEVVDATALDPALKTYRVPQTKDLGGVSITIQKVELSEKQTRIYVRYRNGTDEDFYGGPSLTANGEEAETSYSSDLKEPASSVSPGAASSGVLTFDPVDPDAELRLTYDGVFDANFNEIRVTFVYGA